VIHVRSIGQHHIPDGARVLVVAVRLQCDLLAEDQLRGGLFGSFAERLAFLRAGDPAETDTFRALVAQDLDGVAVCGQLSV
jgi:hypothetical protein